MLPDDGTVPLTVSWCTSGGSRGAMRGCIPHRHGSYLILTAHFSRIETVITCWRWKHERERLENGQATAKNRRQPIIPYQQFGVRVTLWYRSWWHRLC